MKGPYDKRKKDIITAGDAIQELLNSYRLKSKYSQTEVKAAWEEMMGKTIASRTSKLFFKKNVLFVELSSATLKHELNMSKAKMLALLQDKFGKSVVEEIVFL